VFLVLRTLLRDHRAFPLVAAPALAALGVVEAVADTEFREHLGQLVLVAGWFAVSFLVQARWPAWGAVAMACFYPLTALLGAPGPGGTGLIAVMLATGYAGYALPPRRSLAAVSGAVAVFVGTDLALHGLAWDTVFFPAVFYPARWVGRLVRREQERSTELVELAAALDAQREASVEAAAREERTRIAREVHDSVAHSVSVMTLQLGGLRRQLGPLLDDRGAERDVLLGLERLGRETVEELRSLVGILRERGDDDSLTAPVPSLARAEEVVDDVRAAGLDVRLEVVGDPRELPRALDISAYRIVQEALTNVLRHAPGSTATVRVGYTHDAVDIRVRDEGADGHLTTTWTADRGNGGHGIVGMTERAQLFGGTLTACHVGGGFEVHAHLPTNRSHR
jgi:signal transduction histidine kinase